jgi:hypothetical protein
MHQLQHFVTPRRTRLTTIRCLEPKAWTNVETKNHTLPTLQKLPACESFDNKLLQRKKGRSEEKSSKPYQQRKESPLPQTRKVNINCKSCSVFTGAAVVVHIDGVEIMSLNGPIVHPQMTSMGVRCLWTGLFIPQMTSMGWDYISERAYCSSPRLRRWEWDYVSERAYCSSPRWRRWGWDCLWTGLLFIPQMTSLGWDYVSERAYCSSPWWRQWGEIMSLNGPTVYPPDDVDGMRLCLWTGLLFIPQMTPMGWDYVSERAYRSFPRCHAYGEPQWNNTDGRKPKNSGKNLSRRHSAHRKSRMGWLGCEPWHPGWEASN